MDRTVFDTLAELFARDIDRELLRAAMAKSPDERLRWLEEMQAFAAHAREAARNEAPRAPQNAR